MLRERLLKPPVPAVPKAWITLSNTDMPPQMRRIVSKTVMTM